MQQVIRDVVQIDQALLDRCAGSSLLVAARKVMVVSDVVSRSPELILAAEEFDAAGSINASGSDGTPGRDGTVGAQGDISVRGGRGGPGMNGAPGGAGGGAPSIEIYARRVVALTGIESRGGDGAAGGDGGRGGDGARFDLGAAGPTRPPPAAPGGDGGDGGRGGNGGRGGLIRLVCGHVLASPPVFVIDGGTGGPGGQGGATGAGGDVGVPPNQGLRGPSGADGPVGSLRIEVVAPTSFLARFRADHRELASRWAHHRASYAEWLFRTASDDPRRRAHALSELDAAQALATESPPPGDRTRRMILHHQTPIGLAWHYDPAVGFPHYEAYFLAYRDLLRDALEDATALLHTGLTITVVMQVIDHLGQRADAEGLVAAADERVVDFKLAGLQTELSHVISSFEKNVQAQRQRREEIESDDVINVLRGFIRTASAIASAVESAFAIVATIAAIPGAIGKLIGVAEDVDHLVEVAVDFEGDEPRLRPEFRAFFRDLRSLFNRSATIFDAVKTKEALGGATADPLLNALLTESAELLERKARLVTDIGQVKLELEVVGVRRQQSEELTHEALDALRRSGAVEAQLRAMCLRLMTQVRLYADTVNRYQFQAVRALQRWNFDESPRLVSFGLGWVHPDLEAELSEAPIAVGSDMESGQAIQAAIVKYLEGVLDGASRLEAASLRPLYDESVTNVDDPLVFRVVNVSFPRAALKRLWETGACSVLVSLDDLPQAARRGAHVEAVFVYVDAPSSGGGVWLEVTSERGWMALARDGSERTGVEHPRTQQIWAIDERDVLESQIRDELSRLTSSGPATMNPFWGCSPARAWTVRSAGPPGETSIALQAASLVLVVSGHESGL